MVHLQVYKVERLCLLVLSFVLLFFSVLSLKQFRRPRIIDRLPTAVCIGYWCGRPISVAGDVAQGDNACHDNDDVEYYKEDAV